MTKPDDIPQDIWDTAERGLYAAYDAREEEFGRFCNISGGMWESLIGATARAIMAEREACAKLVEELLTYADTTSRADAVIAAAIRNRGTYLPIR